MAHQPHQPSQRCRHRPGGFHALLDGQRCGPRLVVMIRDIRGATLFGGHCCPLVCAAALQLLSPLCAPWAKLQSSPRSARGSTPPRTRSTTSISLPSLGAAKRAPLPAVAAAGPATKARATPAPATSSSASTSRTMSPSLRQRRRRPQPPRARSQASGFRIRLGTRSGRSPRRVAVAPDETVILLHPLYL